MERRTNPFAKHLICSIIGRISMRRISLFILLTALFCSAAHSITWKEVAELGEKNSHDLIAAQKQLESTEWSYRRSYSTFLPQLSASAGYGESEIVEDADITKSYSTGLSASQSIFQGMEGYYGVQSAYANLEYQRADLKATRASVLYDVRAAFIELVNAQENVKLLQKILSQRRQNTNLIQLRYDSGREDRGNLMSTKADEASAAYDLASAKRALELSWLRLSQLLGQDVSGDVEAVDPGKAGKADIHGLLKESPDYVKADKTLEIAQISQKTTISGFLPSLSLRAGYSNSGDEWPPGSANRSWSLNLSYSFFPGGSNFADWAIGAADLDKAKEDHARALNDLLYSLKQSYQSYLDAMDALDVSRVSLAASSERAKITEAKYLNGLTTYDEWSRLSNAYIQAQKSLLSAKRSALLAEAAWHKSYGGWIK